jgi:hypothetical protein
MYPSYFNFNFHDHSFNTSEFNGLCVRIKPTKELRGTIKNETRNTAKCE